MGLTHEAHEVEDGSNSVGLNDLLKTLAQAIGENLKIHPPGKAILATVSIQRGGIQKRFKRFNSLKLIDELKRHWGKITVKKSQLGKVMMNWS